LWHDTGLVEFFDKEYNFFEGLNEGTGIIELPVKALEEAVKLLKKDLKGKELSNLAVSSKADTEYLVERLMRDIEWAKKRKEDYIQYYCF